MRECECQLRVSSRLRGGVVLYSTVLVVGPVMSERVCSVCTASERERNAVVGCDLELHGCDSLPDGRDD